MSRAPSTNRIALPAITLAVALVAGAAILTSGVLGRGADPDPSGSPKPVPTATPDRTPTPVPSKAPDGGDIKVDLDVRSDHDVSVLIKDRTGALKDARTGTPGDGMSVRWHDSKVENIDDSTLRLVWVGWPRDEEVGLSIAKVDGGYEILITQTAPLPNTDAMGYDRMLVLTFDAPVSADDVKVTFKDVPL